MSATNFPENFFWNEYFCTDIDHLLMHLEIEEEDFSELEDDYMIECEATTLEKMFVIKKDFAVKAIVNQTDTWEDRFPEDSDDLFDKIEKAIGDAIDIDKLNEGLPSLYYPNGVKFLITKQDLINYSAPTNEQRTK
jgi:hypothetical protein